MTFNRPGGGRGDDQVHIGVSVTADKAQLKRAETDVKAFSKTLSEAFAPDNATNARARQAFAKHRAELERTRQNAERVSDVYEQWGRILGDIERRGLVDKISDDLNQAVKSGEKLDDALERVKAQLKAIGATENDVRRVLESASNTVRGSVDKGALLREVGFEVRALPAVPIPGTGISTDVVGKIVNTLGKLNVGLSELVVGGGIAVGVVIALGLAIQNFVNTVQPAIERFNAVRGARQTAAGFLATATPEEIISERERLNQELNRLEAERLKAIEDAAATFGAARESGPGAGFLLTNLAELGLGPLADLNKGVQDLDNQITATTIQLEEYIEASDAAQQAIEAERIAKQEAAIADQRILTRLQAQLSVQGQSADAIEERINALNHEREITEAAIAAGGLSDEAAERLYSRLRDINEELPVLTGALPRAQELQRLEQAQQDREAAEKQIQQLVERTNQVREQGEQRLASLAEQGRKQIEDAEKRLSDARTKLIDLDTEQQAKRNEVDAKFMADDLKRLDEFRRRERKLQRDADTERLRDLQDHRDTLNDAEQDNDVAAFLAEQARFQKEQQRKAQDEKTAADDRLDDLEAERQKARDNRDERLAALDAETQKKRADLQAEIAERDAALQLTKQRIGEQLAAEKAAQDEALRNLVAGFDTSSQHMTATIQAAFATLEQAGISSISGIIGELQRRAGTYYGSQSGALLSGATGGSSISFSSVPAARLRSFATGGIADKPMLARIGDSGPGMSEALIPFRKSEGIEAALAKLGAGGGGQQVVFNFSGANFGAMNANEVREIIKTEITPVIRGQWAGIARARGLTA